jgi:hypothetical protein
MQMLTLLYVFLYDYQVRKFGSLLETSAMGFENGMHQLKLNLRGGRNLPRQMVRKFLMQKQCNVWKSKCNKPFECSSRISSNNLLQQFPKAIDIALEKGAIAFYARCSVIRHAYYSLFYNRGMVRSNRFIQFSQDDATQHFGEIICFFKTSSDDTVFCIGRQLTISHSFFNNSLTIPPHLSACLSKFHYVCKSVSTLFCIPVHAIITVCCVNIVDDVVFVSPVLHSDFELQ